MEIRVAPGWNNPDNHDSKYTLREVKYLINQVAAVPGISPASRDLPPRVATFARLCVNGNYPVCLTKGIHQRWNEDPKPHIQISFSFTNGFLKEEVCKAHIILSEEGIGWADDWYRPYRWKTIGVSCPIIGVIEKWPPQYIQNVGYISAQNGGNRRRMSVGCMQPLIPVQPN